MAPTSFTKNTVQKWMAFWFVKLSVLIIPPVGGKRRARVHISVVHQMACARMGAPSVELNLILLFSTYFYMITVQSYS